MRQNVRKWQETAPGYADRAPPGMLAVCSVHFAPFQVSSSNGPAPARESPTAKQLVTVMQDTPVKAAKPAFAGTGSAAVGVSDFPFQVSAYGRSEPAPVDVRYPPTSRHEVADLQETAARLMSATFGFGLGTVTERQVVPFQATTTWVRVPDLSTLYATARQEVGV